MDYFLFPWGLAEVRALLFLPCIRLEMICSSGPCDRFLQVFWFMWTCPGGTDVLHWLWSLVLQKLAKKKLHQGSWQNPSWISQWPWKKQAEERIPHFCNNLSAGFAPDISLLDCSARNAGCCDCGSAKKKSNEGVKQNESGFIISDIGVLYCYSHVSHELSARW